MTYPHFLPWSLSSYVLLCNWSCTKFLNPQHSKTICDLFGDDWVHIVCAEHIVFFSSQRNSTVLRSRDLVYVGWRHFLVTWLPIVTWALIQNWFCNRNWWYSMLTGHKSIIYYRVERIVQAHPEWERKLPEILFQFSTVWD